MKKVFAAIVIALTALAFCACGSTAPTSVANTPTQVPAQAPTQTPEPTAQTITLSGGEMIIMNDSVLKIETPTVTLYADLAPTVAADALVSRLSNGPVTLRLNDYGGWEKVGDLPWSLPRNDVKQTAKPGDIMLYNGSSIVMFYGENEWGYTKIATLRDVEGGFANALSGQYIDVRISLE